LFIYGKTEYDKKMIKLYTGYSLKNALDICPYTSVGNREETGNFVFVSFLFRTIMLGVFVVLHGVEEKQKSDLQK